MVKRSDNLGIDDVVALTGISNVNLRNWEKRYGFPNPVRLENGYRSYSAAQIALLKQIASLLRSGHRIGDLVALVLKGDPLPALAVQVAAPWQAAHTRELSEALFAFDQTHADRLLSILAASQPPERLLNDVYSPLFRSIGEGWAIGKVSVAQEHFATAYLRMHLAPFLSVPNDGRANGKSVVCATLAGELHEGGLMLLTAQLRMRGWETLYLGASVPMQELSLAMRHSGAKLICLSFSDPRTLTQDLPRLEFLPYRICVGGRAVALLSSDTPVPSNVTLARDEAVEAVDTVELAARLPKTG
jgi:methanogenic corrinoid protein MtbC1